jgi:beta-fructofuranosidase
MWAWVFDGPGFKTRGDFGWSGTMSLPRVLSLAKDGTLRMAVPEEIERLRYNPRKKQNLAIAADAEVALDDIRGNSIELAVEMTARGAKQFGVKVGCSPKGEEQTLVFYDAAEKRLKVDTRQSSLADSPKTVEAGPFALKDDEPLRLRIFVDKSVVEVFANDRQAIMRRIYPSRDDSLGVSLFSTGGPAAVATLEAWDLMPSNPY